LNPFGSLKSSEINIINGGRKSKHKSLAILLNTLYLFQECLELDKILKIFQGFEKKFFYHPEAKMILLQNRLLWKSIKIS